jgi:hypothetical protein
MEAGSIAFRSWPEAPAVDGAGALLDGAGALLDGAAAVVVGVLLEPVEVAFLLEQPLTSRAAATETTPTSCSGRRRRCEVTRDLLDRPGGPGRFGAGVARPGQVSTDATHLAS